LENLHAKPIVATRYVRWRSGGPRSDDDLKRRDGH
jgi:hypothetical protein